MRFNAAQFSNALLPIAVTESGMTRLSSFEQSLNAPPAMATVPFGTVQSAALPTGQRRSFLSAEKSTPPSDENALLSAATSNSARAVQPSNAFRSICATVSDMLTFSRAVQPENAPPDMFCTPLSMTALWILSFCLSHGAAFATDEKSGILPLPLMVRAPLRESDQLRPPSMLPLPKASDSAASQTVQVSPSPVCSPSFCVFPQEHDCQCLCSSYSQPPLKSQTCLRKSILSRAMPQPSPPIAAHSSSVPSKLALSIAVPLNAALPMLSRVSGSVKLSILPQFAKAAAPMLFMPSGNSVRLNAVHLKKAFAPISVTLPGMSMFLRLAHSAKRSSEISVSDAGNLTVCSPLQNEKAYGSICSTLSGMLIC